jgi:hypothetical protein
LLALLVALYGYFFWQTQSWTGFNPSFVDQYRLAERKVPAGTGTPGAEVHRTGCQDLPAVGDRRCRRRSDRLQRQPECLDLLHAALSARLFRDRLGPHAFLDNKASFQRGVNQAVRRTAVELVDSLGRVRGTSGINNDLQNARGNLQFDEYSWYFGLNPFGPKTPTPSYYRSAIESLRKFNTDLASCNAVFDGRADNLIQFIDRIANDLGSTSDMLAERSANHARGWFDTRADDRFWFAYGQLYGYYAILSAAQSDFSRVVAERNLGALFGATNASSSRRRCGSSRRSSRTVAKMAGSCRAIWQPWASIS